MVLAQVAQGDVDGYCQWVATRTEYPDVRLEPRCDVIEGLPPVTLRSGVPDSYWDLELVDAIRIALENSRVMRDIGGRVLETPASVSTVFDPACRSPIPRLAPRRL